MNRDGPTRETVSELGHTLSIDLPQVAAVAPTLAARWADLGVQTLQQDMNATIGRGWGDDSAQVVEAHDLLQDARAGVVAVGELLAEGGMGEVRAATQHRLRREVAIKRPRKQAPEGTRAAMLREAWVAGGLEHPNILPIHALAKDGGEPLIVMKRVDGHPWSDDVCRRDDAELDDEWRAQAIRTLIEVCRAVHFAHTRGVLHLDLKPDNVMVGAHGEVVVLDWGIAAAVGPDAPDFMARASSIRTICGTPGYLSPEQADAEGTSFGPHTDVYALGAILHEIITGLPPHRGSVVEMLISAHEGAPPTFADDVPAELQKIAMRALARKPGARFESVEAFRLALQSFLDHQPALALARRADTIRAEISGALTTPEGSQPPRDDLDLSLEADVDRCRFAYQQALRFWPECEAAEDGLAALCELLLARAETHIDVHAAQAAVDDHPKATTALVERANAVRRAAEEDAAKVVQLRALSEDEDPNRHRTARTALALGGAGLWLVWNLVAGEMDRAGIWPITSKALVGNVTAAVLVFVGWLLLGGRHALMATAVNRRALTLIFAAFATTFTLWIGAYLMDVDPHAAAALAMVGYVGAAMAVAVLLDTRTWWVSLAMLVPAVGGALHPEYVFHWTALLGPIGGVGLAYMWRAPQETHASLPPPAGGHSG